MVMTMMKMVVMSIDDITKHNSLWIVDHCLN